MTKRFLTILPVLLAAVMFYALTPLQQETRFYAQTTSKNDPKTFDSKGTVKSCRTLPEAKDGVLLGVIVPCVIKTIQNSTLQFSAKMIAMFSPMFYSFVLLVVALFGVKIVQGEREIHSQTIMLLVKLTIVLTLFDAIPRETYTINGTTVGGVIPSVYNVIKTGVEITTSTLGPNSSQINCDVTQFGYKGPSSGTPLIWAQMDCVLGKIYGFSTGTDPTTGGKTTNMLLASSAVGLLSGFFFGGTFGVAVFFALIGVLWTLVSLVIRTTVSFLNGYLVVCLMLLIAPFFLPLLLLKGTSDYFEKWWKAMLGGLLLPIIISAYSMFALLAYDQIMFQKDSMLQRLFDYPMIQGALEQSRKPCDMRITGNAAFQTAAKDVNPDVDPLELKDKMDKLFMGNPFLQNLANPQLSGANDACGALKVPVLNVAKIKDKNGNASADAKEVFSKIFQDSIKLFIMAYLIAHGLKSVEDSISSLTGSSSASSALKAKSQTERNMEEGYTSMQQHMSSYYVSRDEKGKETVATGAAFVKQTPGAISSGIGAFSAKLLQRDR